MKKNLFIPMFLFSISAFAEKETDLVALDQGVAVIYSDAGPVIITQSDIGRPSLDGAVKTIDDIIFERLMLQEAKKYKIEIDDKAIDKYLETIQREHGLTPRQLKNMFKEAGYTYQEGREQIGMMFAIGELLNFKIRSRLIIPEKDVQAYYDAHPVLEQARAQVKRGFIPFDEKMDKEEQKERIQTRIANKKKIKDVEWSQQFWVNADDIAADKQFLFTMQVGETSRPQQVAGGFEVYKVYEQHPERLVPLSERYREIVTALQEPRYNELYEAFRKELFDGSSIIRF